MNYDLIQVKTSDDLLLNGLYLAGDKSKAACIFIHGFTTDFYSHKFYHSIAGKLEDRSNALILAQTRGTGLQTEFLKSNGEGVFLGSYYEKLDEAHLDISAFIDFLHKEGYEEVVLAGHSLGTIKVVRYLFEGEHKDKISKLILLAPFDKNVFMEIKAPGKWQEYVEAAKKQIEEGNGKEIVPVPEYEDFAMTYETFYSWYVQSDLSNVWDFYKKDYNFPVLQQIKVPVKVILGEKDEFVNYPAFNETAQSVLDTLKKRINHCETHLISSSGHTYLGHEEEVAEQVSSFIK